MDWSKAIEAHLIWKSRLRAFIDGTSQEKLMASAVSRDDQCDLGKWILESERNHASNQDYKDLKSTHAAFHTCAGSIVALVEKGQRDAAKKELSDGVGQYSRISSRCVSQISKFSKKVGQK